ncbi:YcxB family protein [Mycobacterium sp. KBS0706]|uniref:YcxB family protein n=1 Tax=Mycobacterium sp. KBS0706 TaxID=2578109 RepID=UPI00163D4697|nr:YcxB family protein [Mycobacterium sp. KBS0706]
MSVSIDYTVTRNEVWRWYWRQWKEPNGLWRFHVGIFVAVFLLCLSAGDVVFRWGGIASGLKPEGLGCAILIGLLSVLWLPFYPLIAYRPGLRSLSAEPEGLRLRRGSSDCTSPWREIASVNEAEGSIVIANRNRNALIIPNRAFANATTRTDFLATLRYRLEQAKGQPAQENDAAS